jgi:hypothetical protein
VKVVPRDGHPIPLLASLILPFGLDASQPSPIHTTRELSTRLVARDGRAAGTGMASPRSHEPAWD